jgi:hypothetical protein
VAEIFPQALLAVHCLGKTHTRSTGIGIAESVRVSERGERALLGLPEAIGSLSEKLPALSVAATRVD